MTETPPSPSRPDDRAEEGPGVPRWLRRTLIVFGALLLLIVAAGLAARAYFTPDRLASMVVPRVQDRVGREVRISSVRLKLLPRPAVRLEDVALAAAPGLGPEPALDGEAVDLQLALLPLLRREVSVTRLRLVAPTLRYRVAEDGTHSFSGLDGERAAAPEAGGEEQGDRDGRGLPVSEVELERATVVYDDRRSGRGARFRAAGTFAASRQTDAPGLIASRGELRVDSLRILASRTAGDSTRLPSLRLAYEVALSGRDDSLAIRSLEMETEGLRAAGGGSLAWGGETPRVDLRLETGDADLGDLLRLARGEASGGAAEGSLRATLRVAGPVGGGRRPRLEGSARLRDARVAGPGGEPLVSDLSADVSLTGDSLRVGSLEGAFRGRQVRAQAPLVRLSDGGLQVEGLTLRAGESDVTLSAEARDLFPLSRLDPAGGGTGPRPSLDFRLSSERLDLDRLRGSPADADTALAYARLFKAHLSGSRVGGRSAGDVAADRYPLRALPRLDARGRVRVGELVLAGTRMEAVRLAVRLRDGRLRIEGAEALLHGGRLTGALSAEAGDRRRWPVTYDLQLRGADAAELVDRWTKLGRALTGTLDVAVAGRTLLDGSLLPAPERTEAEGRVTVTEGSAEEMVPMQGVMKAVGLPPARIARFDSLGGPFRVRGGRLELDEWRLDSRSGAAGRVAGSVAFAGPLDLDLTLSVPLALLEGSRLVKLAGGEQGGLGRMLSGAAGSDRVIDVPVTIGGTMSTPAVRVQERVFTDRLEDQLKRKGTDLLRGLFERPKKEDQGGGGGG